MMVDIQRLKQKLFHLDVLIEKQEDCYTAHCLQLDLITDGRTKTEAEAMIIDAISEQVTFAIERNLLDYLFQPAAPEEWRKLLYSNHTKNATIRIKAPEGIRRAFDLTEEEFYQI